MHERARIRIFTVEGGDAPLNEGIAVDISIGGMGLITTHSMTMGAKIILEIDGRHFQSKLNAKIAWCGKLPSLGRIIKVPPAFSWRMGLMFEPQSPEEKDLLAKLAANL